MNKLVQGVLVLLTLYTGSSHGQEFSALVSGIDDLQINAYRIPVLNQKKSYLERTKLAVGTILKSVHYGKQAGQDFNQTHNGIYLSINNWSAGTYTNSTNRQSVFITHNTSLYQKNAFKVDLVTGVANGYENWSNAHDGYLPMLGTSLQWQYLKVMLSYDVAAFGFELPLN